MDYKDYYQILGVARTATPAEIKRAYRKLARAHHPDVNKNDPAAERRFKDLNEANAVLSDPDKRARYDQFGPDWEHGPSAPPPSRRREAPTGSRAGGARSGRLDDDLGEFSDFFQAFFGEGLGGASFEGAEPISFGRERVTIPPLEATAELSLEEAFRGTTRLAEIDERRLEVKIPPGVDNGSRVRLAGGAGSGRDLIVVCSVRPHAVFTRKSEDLERELPVRLAEALLGAKVSVGTLKGQVLLTIPPGTQNGQLFRLAGQGMPRLGHPGVGALRVRVRVVLPTKLSPEAEIAAKHLAELVEQPDPRL